MTSLLGVFLVAYFFGYVLCDCEGQPNLLPFYTDEPTLIDQITNGKRFSVGSKENNSTFEIVHLWGETDKDMGVVYGTLLKDDLVFFYNKVIGPFLSKAFVQMFPEDVQKWIEDQGGIFKVLDEVYEATKAYTPQYFYDFMEGFASSSGVDYKLIRRFNMVPQFIKALPPDSACTIIGANLDATTKNGLVQLRALDIGSQNTLMFLFPVVTVMHYDDPTKGNDLVNIFAAGCWGAISAFTKNGLSLSQKVWVTDEKMTEITPGIVWNFHLYDALRYSSDVDEAIENLENAKRTMSMYVGLGDHKNLTEAGNEFYMVRYREDNLTVLTWKNQTTYEYHPQFEGISYYDKSEQPSTDPCLGEDLLNKYQDGEIDGELIARHISPIHETGDAQSIIYDWQSDKVYIAYGLNERKAYNTQYVVLKMSSFFEVQKPTLEN